MVLLILPFIYPLWLFALGRKLLKRQNRPTGIFEVCSLLAFVSFLTSFVVFPLLGIKNEDIPVQQRGFIVLIGLCSFLITILMLTSITVEYERSFKPEYHYTIRDSKEYISRFFVLFYFPFTIWHYQWRVNQYCS